MQVKKTVQIQANLVWQVTRDDSVPAYVAGCPALGLIVEGDTFGELQSLMAEVLDHYFRELVVSGTFDDTLRRLGWRSSRMIDTSGDPSNLRFDVPWSIHNVTPDDFSRSSHQQAS